MYKMRFYVITALLFIIVLSVYSEPAADEVKIELEKLLEKIEELNQDKSETNIKTTETQNTIDKIFKNIENFLNFMSKYILIIIIGITIIAFGIFFAKIFKKMSGHIKNDMSKKTANTISVNGIVNYNYLNIYNRALLLAKNEKYEEALVELHKSSIIYLVKNKYIQLNKEYTNNEIKKYIIDKPELYETFNRLATSAEIVLFRNHFIDKKEYSELLIIFEKEFLNN